MSDLPQNLESNAITPKFVATVQKQMIAFANLQLNDYHMAEDVVQEALMSAMQHSNQFKAEAAFKSWVFAILKNKIVDCIRKNHRYTNISSLAGSHGGSSDEDGQTSGCDANLIESLFDEAGSWYPEYKPAQFDDSWDDPQMTVHNDGFWQILETCLTNLPEEQARAFLMREYVELETPEICQSLNISHSHYYVLMHRARLRLQTCLTIRWFDSDSE